MGCYRLGDTINNLTESIMNSYAISPFVKNPLIAGIIVTCITMAIYEFSKCKKDLGKIFVISSMINVCYMFFNIETMHRQIRNKSGADLDYTQFMEIRDSDNLPHELESEPGQ